MNYQKFSLRLSKQLRVDLRLAARIVGLPTSEFVGKAVEMAADNIPELREEYSRPPKIAGAMVGVGLSVSNFHMDMLGRIATETFKEDKNPTNPVKGANAKPSFPKLFRAVVAMHVRHVILGAQYRSQATESLLAYPREISGLNSVSLKIQIPPPLAFNRVTNASGYLIDATTLLAATVRMNLFNLVDPISRQASFVVRRSIKERVLIHRGDVERYIQLLWKAVRPDFNSLLWQGEETPLEEGIKSAQAYVTEKARLITQSTVELFDLEACDVFDAATLPDSVPLEVRAKVMAARRRCNRLGVVSGTEDYWGLTSLDLESMGILICNLADIDLSDGSTRNSEAPKTSRWRPPRPSGGCPAEPKAGMTEEMPATADCPF